PYLDGIRINVVPDESSLTAALRTKAADMAIITDAKVARTLRSETGVTLDAKPSLSYNLLFVNTKRPPLDNIKVRQAIAYAIDRWLKADFDMAPGLNGGGPDPDFYVYRYFTDDGNLNFVTSYKNPVSSDAIKQARASTDPAKRKDLYTTAQKELVNGVPFIWL